MNRFEKARLELAVRYTFLSAFMLVLFTVAALMAETRAFDLIEEALGDPINRPALTALLTRRLDQFEADFARRLMLFDGILLVLAGIGSYYLAGKTLKPIERMVDEQKEFAAEASHELKTPLAILQLETEALMRQHLNEKAKAKVQILSDEVGRMSRLVERLTAWIRPKQQVALEKIDLSELAAKVIAPLETYWENQKGVKIDFVSESGTRVMANQDELKQILMILVDNACKYSKDGGAVSIGSDVSGLYVRIRVRDQGEGIAKADLNRIFERYYRGRTKQKGMGLGLPIAKKLLTNMKGKIRVESELGKGTMVEVLLPLAS